MNIIFFSKDKYSCTVAGLLSAYSVLIYAYNSKLDYIYYICTDQLEQKLCNTAV